MKRRHMDPAIIGVFVPIVALSGGAILLGMKMHYRHLEDRRLSGGAQQHVEQLADVVENLRAEVEQLNERIEFTERLLERPKTESQSNQ